MKKNKIVRLPIGEALRRLDQMIELIRRDVEIVISVEAALEAANEQAMGDLRDVQFYGAECYNVVANSMALQFALMLAKLFEVPSLRGWPKSTRLNKSDVASIPLMVRLLKQKRCRSRLVERARGWTPQMPSLTESNAKACERAIDRAIGAYAGLRRQHAGRQAIRKLRVFRDKVLAHTLLVVALEKTPQYGELFELARVARQVVEPARLAIAGVHFDLSETMEERQEVSRAFWKSAMAAAARSNTATE
jgi:hypothetical protein